jgi:hypothetical protein
MMMSFQDETLPTMPPTGAFQRDPLSREWQLERNCPSGTMIPSSSSCSSSSSTCSATEAHSTLDDLANAAVEAVVARDRKRKSKALFARQGETDEISDLVSCSDTNSNDTNDTSLKTNQALILNTLTNAKQEVIAPLTPSPAPTPIFVEASLCNDDCRQRVLNATFSVPACKRAAFNQAITQAPHLITTESDPLRFLRVEHGDYVKAAHRLVKYWTMRKLVFGERAFYALDLSGNGAMSTHDIEVLQLGTFVQLPSLKDTSVLYMDANRTSEAQDSPSISQLRCAFFMLSAIANLDKPVILIRFCHSQMINTSKIENLAKLTSSIPIQVQEFHCLHMPRARANHVMKETFLPLLQRPAAGNAVCASMFHHIGETARGLYLQLKTHSFSVGHVPVDVGGSWTFPRHSSWMQSRLSSVEDTSLLGNKLSPTTTNIV